MIRVNQVKLPVGHSQEALKKKTARMIKTAPDAIKAIHIRKQSLDARKKPELFYSYVIDVEMDRAEKEISIVHKAKNPNVLLHQEKPYSIPPSGSLPLGTPPVIIGAGPAGLFCGLILARQGYRPIILERGEDVDARTKKVAAFWETGQLDPESNVQFGEGGAGAFSDGKLNTMVKDPGKRNHLVLDLLVEFGADPGIRYQNKPHIGTDVLGMVVKNIRKEIIRLGGEVRFLSQVKDFVIEKGHLTGLSLDQDVRIDTEAVVLAIGHSARDTFETLVQRKIPMEQKSFAVGLRIQHPQAMIDVSQYGASDDRLGAADYKLTSQTRNGRGVYSFCMCPGGYVVNASSEPGKLAVNGMSYHARDGRNANSALIVTVTPADFPDQTPLGGVRFQQQLEALAYQSAGGKIPVQLYDDFRENRCSEKLGTIIPQMKGEWDFANLRQILPESLNQALMEAIGSFGTKIHGFDCPDAVLAGIESRTSSPVRIWRDETMESEIKGLYPCGEGAGYAGGITSAAMDGVKIAEAIIRRYCPN